MKILNANEKDINEIMLIEKNAFYEEIQENMDTFINRIKSFPEGFLIFKDDDKCCGYFCSEIWDGSCISKDNFLLGHSPLDKHSYSGNTLYISSFAILDSYKGKGFGKSLFFESLNFVLKKFDNIENLILLVNEKWISARKIYKSFNFEEVDIIKDFFINIDGKSDGIIMFCKKNKLGIK